MLVCCYIRVTYHELVVENTLLIPLSWCMIESQRTANSKRTWVIKIENTKNLVGVKGVLSTKTLANTAARQCQPKLACEQISWDLSWRKIGVSFWTLAASYPTGPQVRPPPALDVSRRIPPTNQSQTPTIVRPGASCRRWAHCKSPSRTVVPPSRRSGGSCTESKPPRKADWCSKRWTNQSPWKTKK